MSFTQNKNTNNSNQSAVRRSTNRCLVVTERVTPRAALFRSQPRGPGQPLITQVLGCHYVRPSRKPSVSPSTLGGSPPSLPRDPGWAEGGGGGGGEGAPPPVFPLTTLVRHVCAIGPVRAFPYSRTSSTGDGVQLLEKEEEEEEEDQGDQPPCGSQHRPSSDDDTAPEVYLTKQHTRSRPRNCGFSAFEGIWGLLKIPYR